jgi:cytochrome c oxidase accessory protein FixG
MKNNQHKDLFRDHIGTINADGNRQFIHPQKPSGKLYQLRKVISYTLIGILFISPWIKWNGNPLFLFNILERKFILFGSIFWPQDFYLFFLAMICLVLFVTLFTVAFGRIWCGWVCPQTIFLEMLFRRIEYKIEGTRGQQIKLAEQNWNWNKISKKILKWTLFFIISFLIANTFLAYIIGSDELLNIIISPPSEHIVGFTFLLLFTAIFYFVFAWFREQACIVICPYGRLQGVLTDKNTIQVSYDYERGENRGHYLKKENRSELDKGDCIDCNLCVSVCPTGIDIRNGSQMECVNCTACIDACDTVMDRVKLPKGLIRYTSENNIKKGEKLQFTSRIKSYIAVLSALIIILSALVFTRSSVETSLLRVPGRLYTSHESGLISNLYNFKLLNKSQETFPVELKLLSHNGEIKVVGNNKTILNKEQSTKGTLFIYINPDDLKSIKTKIKVGIYQNGELIDKVKTTFNGPIK